MPDEKYLRTSPAGEPYYWEYVDPGRNQSGRSRLSITARVPLTFRIERQELGQKVAKSLGFVHEYQTGESRFDDSIFVACDDPVFCGRLHSRPGLRQVILRFFDNGARAIIMEENGLSVDFYPLIPALPRDQIAPVIAGLTVIKEALPVSVAEEARAAVSRVSRYNWFIQCLLYGGLGLTIIDCLQDGQLIDKWPMAEYTAGLSVALMALLLMVVRESFIGSSMGYEVLRKSFMALTGILLCSHEALYNLNRWADSGPGRIIEEPVIDKYYTSGRHNAYYVRVAYWHESARTIPLNVSHYIYQTALAGSDKARITIHLGFLGLEWISYSVFRP